MPLDTKSPEGAAANQHRARAGTQAQGAESSFATSGYFQSFDGLRLHYRDYPGPAHPTLAVICLPGLTRNARDFEPLARRLATRYRVICLDFRGRGSSQYASDPMSYVPSSYVRDLTTLFDETGLAHAALIGTSLGGLVGMLFSAMRPEKVVGLVLNDVGPEADPAGLARIGSYVGKMPPITGWEDAARAIEQVDRSRYPDYGAADWMRVARCRYVEGADGQVRLDYDPSIARAFATPATTPDVWPFFRQLRDLPILLIRGAHSDILSPVTVERMIGAVPAMKIVEVPDRGHAPSLEEPSATSAIDAFLARLADRSVSE